MAMMGGMRNSVIDREGVTEEEIRTEVRKAIEDYSADDRFFPCLPSLIWPVVPENDRFIQDEITKYGREFYQASRGLKA